MTATDLPAHGDGRNKPVHWVRSYHLRIVSCVVRSKIAATLSITRAREGPMATRCCITSTSESRFTGLTSKYLIGLEQNGLSRRRHPWECTQ